MYPIQNTFFDTSKTYHPGNETTSAALEGHQTALSQEKMASVTTLQAHIRGWKARNEVFLTQQILLFVKQHFVEYKQYYLDIARMICSALNQISLSPHTFQGKSITIDTERSYTFLKPGEQTERIPRPFRLYIELDQAGKNVELLAVPEGKHSIINEPLGQGSFKYIYPAQDIAVPRELISDQRTVQHTLSVLVFPKKGDKVFQKGYNIHKEILENVQGKFVDLYVPLKPSSNDPADRLYKQIWYNCTFQDAAKHSSIPITFFPNSEQVDFTLKDKLNVFSDVAKSLQALHEKGYVHRDIKANNLFIKINSDQKPEGYIGDFDTAQKIGITDISGIMNDDFLASKGLVFPTTDIRGLVFAWTVCLNPMFLNTFTYNVEVNDPLINRTVTEHAYKSFSSSSKSRQDQLMKELTVKISSGEDISQRTENFWRTEIEFSKLTCQFNMKTTGEIEPSYSPQQLVHLFQDFRQLHSALLDIRHINLLNRLEIEIPVINEMFILIKDVFTREISLKKTIPLDKIKMEVQELKDPAELMNYFNNQIVPMLYDPKEVCAKIQSLAKRVNLT